jgi:hypothetical protein
MKGTNNRGQTLNSRDRCAGSGCHGVGMIRTAGTVVFCLSLLLATQAFGREIWVSPDNPNGSGHYTELLQSATAWPLIFGREYSGPNACRDSIESLAAQVAQKVAQARSVFPDIQVGDIEPIGNPRPGWLTDIAEWTKAYRAATGTPLAFFQFDVDWNNPNWPQQLKAGADLMQSLGIPIASRTARKD